MIIRWRESRLRRIGKGACLTRLRGTNTDPMAGQAQHLVGRPPDFHLQIQEAGGMTYNPMREMIASRVRCGRKPAIAGPRVAFSQRIRDREMLLVQRGEAG